MAPLTPSTARCALVPAGGPLRRPYRTSDYRYLVQYYPHRSAKACATVLGRTVGSLRFFVSQHPELRKRGRP